MPLALQCMHRRQTLQIDRLVRSRLSAASADALLRTRRMQAFQQQQLEAAHRAGLMAAASGLGAARPGAHTAAQTAPPPVRFDMPC